MQSPRVEGAVRVVPDPVYLPLRLLWLEKSRRKGLSPKKRDLKVVSKLWGLGGLGACVRPRCGLWVTPHGGSCSLPLKVGRRGQEVVGRLGVLPKKDLVQVAVVCTMGAPPAAPPPQLVEQLLQL